MTKSPLVRVVSTLWKMLNRSRRIRFSFMIFCLFVAGLLDMTGMILIFGFIAGLRVGPNGEREGRLGKLLDALGEGGMSQQEYVFYVGGLVVGVLIFKNALSTLVQFYLNKFLMKLNQRVSEGLFDGYLRTPYEHLNAAEGGTAAGNISRIFDVFSSCFGAVSQLLADGTMLIMVALLLCLVDPLLTSAGIVLFGGLGAGLYWGMQRGLVSMGREDKVARKTANQYLADGIEGVVDTRLRDARQSTVTNYARSLARTALLRRRKVALERLPRSTNEIMLASMIVGSVFYLLHFGDGIDAALPTLGLFGFAGLRMTSAMSRVNAQFQKLKAKAEEFEGYYYLVLDLAPQIFGEDQGTPSDDYLKDEAPLPPGVDGRLHDKLSVRGVTFTYPGSDAPAVRGVSLEVAAGSFVGLCGPSGGGKSTLALLMMGLLRPTEGAIECDGSDVFRHIRAWHRNIGYVGQDMYISKRTVRENVAFAVPQEDIKNKRVWRVLKLASADEFVGRLPKRLGHRLRNRGANLSGGQRQRIAIARALYHNPDIVVFDEATAALDNVTEREISDAIRGLRGDKTVICVAHRLTSIMHCDRIYLVSNGTIEASGTYRELIEQSPTFRALALPREGESSDPAGPEGEH